MCKGNCGKCNKAEFETTDVQVELVEWSGATYEHIKRSSRAGMQVFGYDNSISTKSDDGIKLNYSGSDIKIGMTDGDDSQELQPTCIRASSWSQVIPDGQTSCNSSLKSGDLCIARSFLAITL